MATKVVLSPEKLKVRKKEAEVYIKGIPQRIKSWKSIDNTFQYDVEEADLTAELEDKVVKCREYGFDDLADEIQVFLNEIKAVPINLNVNTKKDMAETDAFLPQDYEVPSTDTKYMKWQDGENRFRVLGNPIMGWEDWDDDRHVFRYRMSEKPAVSQSTKKGAKVKHFWAMVVYNVNEKKIQILQITQSSIQNAIGTLSKDEDWGNPRNYDIVVTKTGEQLDTEYQITPKPAKPLDPEVAEEYKKTKINLEALFDNADPFGGEEAK